MQYQEILYFIGMVRSMRDLQKAYFKSRDTSILREAKAAEKAVDDFIASQQHGPKQATLF